MRFVSKNVIVTGAARGIGRAIARRFGAEGARVAIVDIDEAGRDSAEEIAADGGTALFRRADVTDGAQVASAVAAVSDHWGAINVLVNNAGVCPFEEFLDISEASWRRVIDINLTGAFLMSQAVARQMIARRSRGSIVTVSSLSGTFASTKQAHYSASKAGLNLLVRSMATSLAPHGIRSNAVLPGAVETDLNAEVMADAATRSHWERRAPLGRLGQPGDVAGPVLFFASEEATWCTGALLAVDGGTSATL